MKKKLLVLAALFLVVCFASRVFAADDFTHIISNSEDWRDVYSSILYANLKGVGSNFLVSTRHGTIILNEIPKNNKIRVMTSKKSPYVFNYPSLIKSRGFKDADEIVAENFNLKLIDDLKEVNNFIIVDDSYGFNAIAVAPYAVKTHSWVFFANDLNIFKIDSILSKRNINKIIIYGYTTRRVRDVLSKYNPEIINTGDRFQDNIEIVKKYLKINPTKQVILSNGEFIEKEIMAGDHPLLFTGKENVPDKIRDYLKNSEITIGVLIGNDLIGAATNIRRTTGISVMVKFARGARGQTGGVAAVEGLDIFPVPTPHVSLSLYSIKYNKASSQLEVTYKSDSNLPIYLKGTITLISETETTKVGDLEPIFIAPGDYKTIVYPLDISPSENLEAEFHVLFGETASSLDRILEGKARVDIINVIDRCKFDQENIKSVKYSKQKKSFLIKIKNTKEVDCWTDVEIENLIVDSVPKTIGTENNIKIPSGKTKTIRIKEKLTNEDLENNPSVNLIVYSGEKEDSLVNVLKGNFPLKIEFLSTLTYALIILIAIILILIIIIIIKKKKEEY